MTSEKEERKVDGERVKTTSRQATRGDGGEKMWCLGQKNEAIRLWDLVLTIPGFTVIDCGLQISAVQHHTCHRCLPDGAGVVTEGV